MANYLIVVPRNNTELFDLLSVAFRGHTGFNVVIDRRTSNPMSNAPRSSSRTALGPDEIVVAERTERTDHPSSGNGPIRSIVRVPVRRRRRAHARAGARLPQPSHASAS
jgi:hypothetical protein